MNEKEAGELHACNSWPEAQNVQRDIRNPRRRAEVYSSRIFLYRCCARNGAVTAESINFVADALYPATSRLDELWHQWAKLQKSAGEKEG